MLKLIITFSVFMTGLFAGPIKNQVDFINKNASVTMRIEKKLDLILAQYIKAEEEQEARDRQIKNLRDKTKEGFDKSKNWLKEKAEVFMEEPLIKKLREEKNSSSVE